MNEEEKNIKNDILFQIDMQLYGEFNDTIATMNDNLGNIYSLRDVEEVEKAEKEKEVKLLREAIKKQQKELEKKDNIIKSIEKELRKIKKDLDIEPWSIYKVDGKILFDMANLVEKENK